MLYGLLVTFPFVNLSGLCLFSKQVNFINKGFVLKFKDKTTMNHLAEV